MTEQPQSNPQLKHVRTLFRIRRGPTRRTLRCALYRIDTVLELRMEYEDRDDDVQHSRLFRESENDAITKQADEWRRNLRAKGFEELPVDESGGSKG